MHRKDKDFSKKYSPMEVTDVSNVENLATSLENVPSPEVEEEEEEATIVSSVEAVDILPEIVLQHRIEDNFIKF